MTLIGRQFSSLLEDLAAPPPSPSGGVAATAALSMAAALVTMVARVSAPAWPEGAGVAAQAGRLEARAARLADEGTATFAAARAALRPHPDQPHGDAALGAAMTAAMQPLVRAAELAADVATLAALAAREGDLDVRADAVVAAVLGAAAARSAAHLVGVNLVVGEGDTELVRARRAAAAAGAAADDAESV